MARALPSRPVALALSDGVIGPGTTVFDYGCGRGADIRHLRLQGINVEGWDPVFAPEHPRCPAEVVNLGYVVNVIEDPAERVAVLRAAWDLAQRALVVSARLRWEEPGLTGRRLGDGIVTKAGTFQRFYDQDELRDWVEAALGTRSVAAAPGIFYVFRHRADSERLLSERARRGSRQGGGRIADILFEQHREPLERLREFVVANGRIPSALELREYAALADVFGSIRGAFLVMRRAIGPRALEGVDIGVRTNTAERRFAHHYELLGPLLDFVEERGRLPHSGELANESELNTSFGSVRQAFSLVRRATGGQRWHDVTARRRDDFLVYLALSAFGGRPKFSELPEELRFDARDFFGSYQAASKRADALLFAAGDSRLRDEACRDSPFGKLTPEALYLHQCEAGQLAPVLRVYEGCGRALSGSVDGANIIKLHRQKSQVSYLSYPSFDTDAHPRLTSVVISQLSRLDVTYRDFNGSENPPVLHRKETFVSKHYPGRQKFERLTQQEERHGLLANPETIGTMQGWDERLRSANWALRGHRLVRTSTAPSAMRSCLDP
jgi:hypothetical protein